MVHSLKKKKDAMRKEQSKNKKERSEISNMITKIRN